MNWDDQLFLSINQALCGPWSSTFFTFATRLGNGMVLAALIVPAMFFFDRRRFKQQLLPLVLSVACGGLFVTWTKVAVDRPRPPDHFARSGIEVHTPLGSPSDKSFPSGHTETAFAAAVYLCCCYRAATPLFLILASLVGLSRIALGVHFPSDVLVGALLGTLFALAGYYLNSKRLLRRKSRGIP